FGADAAPLTALRDLPVDYVKLDRSFVDRMTNSATDWAVARAVTELGNSLKIMTMADGIERVEQLAALRSIGCYAGQGYYVSRPLPASGIERLLTECTTEDGTLRLASFGAEKRAYVLESCRRKSLRPVGPNLCGLSTQIFAACRPKSLPAVGPPLRTRSPGRFYRAQIAPWS